MWIYLSALIDDISHGSCPNSCSCHEKYTAARATCSPVCQASDAMMVVQTPDCPSSAQLSSAQLSAVPVSWNPKQPVTNGRATSIIATFRTNMIPHNRLDITNTPSPPEFPHFTYQCEPLGRPIESYKQRHIGPTFAPCPSAETSSRGPAVAD